MATGFNVLKIIYVEVTLNERTVYSLHITKFEYSNRIIINQNSSKLDFKWFAEISMYYQ